MTAPSFLFQGEDYLAVEKPAGMLVIPGRGPGGPGPSEGELSLRQALELELKRKIFVVHRLDRDTSGIVLFALTAPAHRTLSMAFEAGQIGKSYQALVEGRWEEGADVQLALVPARRGKMRPARPGEAGKPAQTLFRPLEPLASATLVEAQPRTGRTHQIRVHLASVGHPLLFDHQYGRGEPWRANELGGVGDAVVLRRTPLHASEVRIPALEGLRPRTLRSPLPADFAAALALLRAQSVP